MGIMEIGLLTQVQANAIIVLNLNSNLSSPRNHHLGSHRNAEAYEKADTNPSGIKPRRVPGGCKRLNKIFSEFALTPVIGLTLPHVFARVS